MTQPYYQVPPQPQVRKKDTNWLGILASIIGMLIILGFALYFGSYMLTGHPPLATNFIYKEYPDVEQAYKNIHLGDRIKVTITVTSSTPVNGIVQVGSDSYRGITFRFSPNNKIPVQLHTGKNIVYCFVSEKLLTSFYCDIEEVQP